MTGRKTVLPASPNTPSILARAARSIPDAAHGIRGLTRCDLSFAHRSLETPRELHTVRHLSGLICWHQPRYLINGSYFSEPRVEQAHGLMDNIFVRQC